MSLYCTYCNRTLDDDEIEPIMEWYGEDRYSSNSSGWYCEGERCKYCGNDELEEAKSCDCCGRDFGAESGLIYVDDTYYCKDCAEEVATKFIDFWGMTDGIKASIRKRGETFIKMRQSGLHFVV